MVGGAQEGGAAPRAGTGGSDGGAGRKGGGRAGGAVKMPGGADCGRVAGGPGGGSPGGAPGDAANLVVLLAHTHSKNDPVNNVGATASVSLCGSSAKTPTVP